MEIEADHPEFKKLAFTSPGPKNAFAPLQRSGYGRPPHMAGGCVARGGERREEATEAASTTAAESKRSVLSERGWPFLMRHLHIHTFTYRTLKLHLFCQLKPLNQLLCHRVLISSGVFWSQSHPVWYILFGTSCLESFR